MPEAAGANNTVTWLESLGRRAKATRLGLSLRLAAMAALSSAAVSAVAAGSGAAGFTAASGRLNLEGLQKNKYRAIWWDTAAGKQLDSSEVVVESTKQDVEIATPPITRDVALYVVRAGIRTASTKSKRDKQSVKPASLTTGSTTAAP